jgi:hypothetical protein
MWIWDLWELVPSACVTGTRVDLGPVGPGPNRRRDLWDLVPGTWDLRELVPSGFWPCGNWYQVNLGTVEAGSLYLWELDLLPERPSIIEFFLGM